MANTGNGTTITFGTSSFSANLLSVGGPGRSRGSIETSHMGTTTSHTFIPDDLVDNGEVSLEFEFNGYDTPPINGAVETITIAWGGTGDTWAFSGFMTNYEPSAAMGDRMTATATLKVTGDITITDNEPTV